MQKRFLMPGESTDARAVRARDRITMALAELAREKVYDDITVQDVAQRAQVSRTTFYAHFQDRDSIPLRLGVVFGDYLGRQLGWDGAAGQYRFPLASLLEHMLDIRPLYDALHRAGRTDHLLKVFRINMAKGFERRIDVTRKRTALAATGPTLPAAASLTSVPAPLLAQHLAATVVQLLTWWMENHCPMQPLAVEEHFHRLVAGLR